MAAWHTIERGGYGSHCCGGGSRGCGDALRIAASVERARAARPLRAAAHPIPRQRMRLWRHAARARGAAACPACARPPAIGHRTWGRPRSSRSGARARPRETALLRRVGLSLHAREQCLAARRNREFQNHTTCARAGAAQARCPHGAAGRPRSGTGLNPRASRADQVHPMTPDRGLARKTAGLAASAALAYSARGGTRASRPATSCRNARQAPASLAVLMTPSMSHQRARPRAGAKGCSKTRKARLRHVSRSRSRRSRWRYHRATPNVPLTSARVCRTTMPPGPRTQRAKIAKGNARDARRRGRACIAAPWPAGGFSRVRSVRGRGGGPISGIAWAARGGQRRPAGQRERSASCRVFPGRGRDHRLSVHNMQDCNACIARDRGAGQRLPRAAPAVGRANRDCARRLPSRTLATEVRVGTVQALAPSCRSRAAGLAAMTDRVLVSRVRYGTPEGQGTRATGAGVTSDADSTAVRLLAGARRSLTESNGVLGEAAWRDSRPNGATVRRAARTTTARARSRAPLARLQRRAAGVARQPHVAGPAPRQAPVSRALGGQRHRQARYRKLEVVHQLANLYGYSAGGIPAAETTTTTASPGTSCSTCRRWGRR